MHPGSFFIIFSCQSHVRQIIIAVSVTPLSAPIIIADKQGYFANQGLDIRLDQYIGGMRTAKAMFESKADFATSSEVVVMFNSFTQNDFYIVSTFVESDNDVKLLTSKKTGIRSVTDLNNRRIGTINGTSSAHYFLDQVLLINGIDTGGKDIVKINPEDTSKVLLNRQVDAVASWEPFISMARSELGKNAVIVPHDKMYTETFNLIVKKDFVRKNPGVVEKILTALKQAVDYISQNERLPRIRWPDFLIKSCMWLN